MRRVLPLAGLLAGLIMVGCSKSEDPAPDAAAPADPKATAPAPAAPGTKLAPKLDGSTPPPGMSSKADGAK